MLSAERRDALAQMAERYRWPTAWGRVRRITGLLIEATLEEASIGDIIEIERTAAAPLRCEVVGIGEGSALAIGLGPTDGVKLGANARVVRELREFPAGRALLGRVLDPFGAALDGEPPPRCEARVSVDAAAPQLDQRGLVSDVFETGVRVIDGLLTCGRGQRVGIFAGAGVGKSVLVEQIARQSSADVVVVGLIGERGREVRELANSGSAKSGQMVIVAATSDRSPMERIRGARSATAVAEHFAAEGKNVLLVIDSLTRYAMALREVGLALGEPAATKGYTPSVFAELPRLLERATPYAHGGSITGFYTVLVEGDDLSDPVADAARSLLDGHIVLDRELAGRAHFPAVDVLSSASRVMMNVCASERLATSHAARAALAERRQVAELVSLGAYIPGTNPDFDRNLALGERLDAWARQAPHERSDLDDTALALEQALALDPKEDQ